MIIKQAKMYREWLKATRRNHSLTNLSFFIKQYYQTLTKMAEKGK